MNREPMDPILLEPAATPVQPDLLVSAVLHLMSHYTVNQQQDAGGCVRLASVIERHLKAIADVPNLAPVLRATCQQLSEQWAVLVERTMPQAERLTLFARLGVRTGRSLG